MGSNRGHNHGTEAQRRLFVKGWAAATGSERERAGGFRRDWDGDDARRSFLAGIALALLALFLTPAQSRASELKQQTLAEWNDYIHSACLRTEERAKASPFLRISEPPERRARARAGEIIVWREGDGHAVKVHHGLIHDWAGSVFIPNATIADVFAVVRNYDRYPETYKPAVVQAKGRASDVDDDSFSMLFVQKVLFVTAAVQGEYKVQYTQIDPKHWYSISQSTRLQAVEGLGQAGMRVLPPDHGPGYVWRLYSFTRFEESDGGVYVEVEAIGLSRDVPALFRWIVDPVVEHLPKDGVHDTLEKTRNAVLERVNRQD